MYWFFLNHIVKCSINVDTKFWQPENKKIFMWTQVIKSMNKLSRLLVFIMMRRCGFWEIETRGALSGHALINFWYYSHLNVLQLTSLSINRDIKYPYITEKLELCTCENFNDFYPQEILPLKHNLYLQLFHSLIQCPFASQYY
jgi:hypothetical protein